jgi:hypothetical protein
MLYLISGLHIFCHRIGDADFAVKFAVDHDINIFVDCERYYCAGAVFFVEGGDI